jgi:hypothetical protein
VFHFGTLCLKNKSENEYQGKSVSIYSGENNKIIRIFRQYAVFFLFFGTFIALSNNESVLFPQRRRAS